MKSLAYDECYLDMMFQKTRFLFKLIARNRLDVFSVITDYMRGLYRKYMDMGNPLYLNKTPKQILGDLGYRVDMNADLSLDYDEMILEWMADIYVYMQWRYKLWSARIVETVKPETLYKMYYPLHEASIANEKKAASAVKTAGRRSRQLKKISLRNAEQNSASFT